MEIGEGAEFKRRVMERDKAAQKSASHLENNVPRAKERLVRWNGRFTRRPFTGVSKCQSDQNARIKKNLRHPSCAERRLPVNRYQPLPKDRPIDRRDGRPGVLLP